MIPQANEVILEASGAFVDCSHIAPTRSGKLDGLSFAVKDLIDVAGRRTGCGNPHWRDTHPPAASHAVCVEQLLAAGARCVGKTVTDEFAFSLLGENYFYGTPLNPHAPDRVPGGSSNGSASAVACRLVDFALGTDTGGSVRVPAHNCGLYGFRPSHGLISMAGVMPLAPSFDTVGILAGNADVLADAAAVLLGALPPDSPKIGVVHFIREAFACCDADVAYSLEGPLQILRNLLGERCKETSIHAIDEESEHDGMIAWFEVYYDLQCAEIWNSLGPWLSGEKPELSPAGVVNFTIAQEIDRRRLNGVVQRRRKYAQRLAGFLGPGNLLCIPTAPIMAPLKGSIGTGLASLDYYSRVLPVTALSGVGRLPQISLPLAHSGNVPIGLSLLSCFGEDAFLLSVGRFIAKHLSQKFLNHHVST